MVLAELQNWQECRTAVLEYDNDSIHLYSHPHNDNLELKALWVANTKKRLFCKSDIKSDMDKGLQPYMPKKYCTNDGYITDFEDTKNWRLQWGLEQNSIAVYFKGKIIAIMPEWSGVNGFYGYSLGVSGETAMAWELSEDNIQIARFLEEKKFLDSWSEETWISLQEGILEKYDAHFSGETKYFAADGGKWPPLGIHHCNTGNLEFMATVGMSQLPMPLFGMPYDEPKEFRRIELALIFRQLPDFRPLAQYLSGQAAYPWHFGSHFDNGHTIPCAQLKEVGANASFMAITNDVSFLPNISLPPFCGDSVRMLYMFPIHESEQQYAEKRTTRELLSMIEEKCDDPLDIFRKPVV